MSSKNKLQEFFQKRGTSVPEYHTIRCGGVDHNPLWISEMRVDHAGTEEIIKSEPHANKKLAESNLAEKVYKILSVPVASKCSFIFEERVAILIDAENKPLVAHEFIENIRSTGIDLFVFYSLGHPSSKKVTDDPRVIYKPVPSSRPDGADVGMTIFIGTLIEKNEYKSFLIVSSDHFAHAAVDVIRGYNKDLNVFVCCSMDDIIERLLFLV